MGEGVGQVTSGRTERRAQRRTKVAVLFADRTDRALDLLELVEMAWHDNYNEITPPEDLIDDILLLSEGNLRLLIRWGRIVIAVPSDVRDAANGARADGT
jgi:hypothetical protein